MSIFLLTLSQDRWDEQVIKQMQEEVGYNCPVVIRRSTDSDYVACMILPCDDYPDGKVLWNTGDLIIGDLTIKVSANRAFSNWCDDNGVKF